ncbi:hypothetical protein QAD02_012167 [Eretmocerus hayati]|uniref:Uncharacterized protein n=1 Tax=Eretmocerus hayati TaxID=131215 RepID=A0ACC2P3N6_9HYME|nr:hypothetical protein QAD02_012167 [Eretmocerus hayati]
MWAPHTRNACRTHSLPLLLILFVLLVMVSYSLGIEVSLANDTSGSTMPTLTSTTTSNLDGASEKIARRIAEERAGIGAGIRGIVVQQEQPWKRNKVQTSVTPVTEIVDEKEGDKATLKRTVGPSQEPIEISSNGDSGAKSREANINGSVAAGDNKEQQPAARFHGNKPLDDRYNGHGWRTSSYLNYGKDKGYYDQRAHYPYDRYNAQRPLANYAADTERFSNTAARPNTNVALDGDRYGSSVPAIRPLSNYQSANYGYGDNRPRPGYYGTVNANINSGDGGEGGEYPAGDPGQHNAYLQTQKAVALKALAGVALIGAAAALASNPVLLPISVISAAAAGRRRKRSTESDYIAGVEEDSTSTATDGTGNYALAALLQGYIQPVHPNEVSSEHTSASSETTNSTELDNLKLDEASHPTSGSNKPSKPSSTTGVSRQELVISPRCVARLACHVHRDYLDELERSRARAFLQLERDDSSNATKALSGLENFFDSLVHSNILGADYLSDELKTLIRSAVAVGSNRNASCDEFSCLDISESLVINKP